MFIHTFLMLIIGTKMCIEKQNRNEVKETTFNIQSKAILLRHILTKNNDFSRLRKADGPSCQKLSKNMSRES